MLLVPDDDDSYTPQAVIAAVCVDEEAFDRLGRVLRYLAVGLVDQAVHVRLLSSDRRIESLSLGPIQTVLHEPIVWPFENRRISKVLEAAAHQAPTVVHGLSAGSYRLATALADAFDADLVLQVTSLTDCDRIAQMDHGRVGAFLAFSGSLARVLEEQLKAPADRIELVRPGILASQQIACFARPEGITTLLCTANFERERGVDRLIDAIDLLRQRGHELLAFLLGRGRQESALRRMVRDRNLASYVAFAHPLGDHADAMKSADIFVRPTNDGVFTADALQAMGAGMAVVSFPSTVCDYLRHGETAVICAESTGVALADALEELIVNRDRAREVAAASADYVRSHHAMSAMAERTANTYRKLALARATFPITE